MKHYLRRENEVNKNKVLSYLRQVICNYTYATIVKKNKKLFSITSNLQTRYHFKQDFKKDQHIGGE